MTLRSRMTTTVAAALLAAAGLSSAVTPATAAGDAPATKPATQPAVDVAKVPQLSDSALLDLCSRLFPDVTRDIRSNGVCVGEGDATLKAAVADEVAKRGDAKLKARLAEKSPADPARLSDADLELLLRSGTHELEFAIKESHADQLRLAMDPLVHEALRRNGRAAAVALGQWRFPDLSWAGDATLAAMLKQAYTLPQSRFSGLHNHERILNEILARGGKAWTARLEELLAAREKATPADAWHADGPELLIALRRLQGKGDPLVIETSAERLESTFPALPTLKVALTNVDVEEKEPLIQHGGDYRSGRQTRWRIEARDAAGHDMPVRPMRMGMAGGLTGTGPIKFGQRLETTLPVSSYLFSLPPGDYTLRVLYHDSVTIADQATADGLICCTSAPLKLTVHPLQLAPDAVAAAAKKVPDLLAAIPEEGKLKLVAGTYGGWAHAFVPPQSPQGQLLSLGLPAVPPLLDALNDPKLTPRRRAQILSLLFSLTGQNDPTENPASLGAFESKSGPWTIEGAGQMAFGFHQMSSDIDTIDEKAQKALAEKWQPWRKCIVPAAGKTAAEEKEPERK